MPSASNEATTATLTTSKNGVALSKVDNLVQIQDSKQRKKVQNRIAQRTYRKKIKERLESFEQWQESVANAFPNPSNPNPSPFESPIINDASDENRQESPAVALELAPNSALPLNPGPERSSISWTPTLDTLLSMDDFIGETNNVPNEIPTSESAWELPRSRHDDSDLAMFDSLSNTEEARTATVKESLGKESLVSGTSMLTGPKDESAQSSAQLGGPDDGKTALHLAAEKGEHVIVCILLDRMRDIHVQDQLGRTALYLAVENRHENVVEALVAKRHGVNVQDHNGQTALHVAVAAGEEGMVELLLQADPDLELKDVTGRTALHKAAQMGCDKVMQQLLNKGADIAARIG